MKFNDILMAIDNNTKIRVTITQYGMKFSTSYHYGEYFLDNKELDELTERRVLDMRVVDNLLEVVLNDNQIAKTARTATSTNSSTLDVADNLGKMKKELAELNGKRTPQVATYSDTYTFGSSDRNVTIPKEKFPDIQSDNTIVFIGIYSNQSPRCIATVDSILTDVLPALLGDGTEETNTENTDTK